MAWSRIGSFPTTTRCWPSSSAPEWHLPSVTTIVPTFRRPQLLKRAVYSVLNQTHGDFIVWILDNASDDATEGVAQELMRLDPRVRYHRHPSNIGSLQNMIYGMERVTTPYFNILCDDDLLMPEFLEACVRAYDEAEEPPALVSARVVATDAAGRIAGPYAHPRQRLRLQPPDGVKACLTAGLSLTGVLYRTEAAAVIGPPRTAWWNWTESGWHALFALQYPIAFTPHVGAIVYVHPDGASKQMEGTEFRVSWFAMLAELREATSKARLPNEWWTRHIQPLAYSRFFGSVVRLCHRDGATQYGRLGSLAIACGLNAATVRAVLALARTARCLGLGAAVNGVFGAMRVDAPTIEMSEPVADAPDDEDLLAAWHVWMSLNRQAGVC